MNNELLLLETEILKPPVERWLMGKKTDSLSNREDIDKRILIAITKTIQHIFLKRCSCEGITNPFIMPSYMFLSLSWNKPHTCQPEHTYLHAPTHAHAYSILYTHMTNKFPLLFFRSNRKSFSKHKQLIKTRVELSSFSANRQEYH